MGAASGSGARHGAKLETSRRSVLRRLTAELVPHRTAVGAAAASVAALGGAQLYLTWLAKDWVGSLVSPGAGRPPETLLVLAAWTTAATAIALFTSRVLVSRVNHAVVANLREKAMTRILTSEPSQIRERAAGDLVTRLVGDTNVLAQQLPSLARRLPRELIVVSGAIVLMFVLHWRLALAVSALVPPTVWCLDRLGRVIRRRSRATQQAAGTLGALAGEQIQGLSTIKAAVMEAAEIERFTRASHDVRSRAVSSEIWAAILLSVVFVVTGIGLIATLAWAGQMLADSAIEYGALLAFCLYGAQTIEPLRRLSELQGTLQASLASAERIYEIIDMPVPAGPVRGATPVARAEGAIEIDAVRFHYREDEPVLCDLRIRIAAREQVAVVARSGGGKSTLGALLVRFCEPVSGVIRIDRRDIATVPRGDLRTWVFLVEQESFLFSGPVIDNLRYGSPNASVDAIQSALEAVQLGSFARSLPEGLSTPLVEAGRDLSGGQRQRIALARAILRDPAILILDEATSAIDSETEAALFEGLSDWLARRTVIAMAHRLSTVLRFPRCLVLDEGRVVADGDPDVLVSGDESFRRLFADQVK